MGFLTKLLSFGEGKQMDKYRKVVDKINGLEPEIQALDDVALAAQTARFRERLERGEALDDLLPEAFATVREASWRTLGMRHFDVQLIGGMVLHEGSIAEMKTGEGKTLVSTLAGYLNALPGNNVHIVTVNDYLAKRDSEWMGQVYQALGMNVGLIQNGMLPAAKIPAYQADVTYGTNSEFGFDYLRDNMVTQAKNRVQRGHHFAIVDEVDSILIDEARTPLIISGAGMAAASTYQKFARVMPNLREGVDFEKDEAKRTITCTEVGLAKVETLTGIEDIYADPSGQLANHLQQALRAQFLYHKDVDYVVMNGEVKIVDEFTGRIMEGRRWSEGLHQAVEAKERVQVRQENQTLATITLQNYFRLYEKLSGMTGTAMTQDAEFRQVYNIGVVAIPSNKPVARKDEVDVVYRTVDAKFNAVADDIAQRHAAGQPCLVGTVSIESSERLSRLLDKRGIDHEILNAKNHEREAHIVAQAGREGAVTIATNMAGRGTDILLGGNPDVLMEDVLRQRGLDPEKNPFEVAEEEPEVVEEAAKGKDTKAEEETGLAAPTEEQWNAAKKAAKETCAAEHDKVIALGGLAVIGTERHESRRIDNQLRGRAGRQGDPGSSQFYLSLEDDLMRLFGGDRMDRISAMMERTQIPDDMPIQAGMVGKSIETAQHNVETIHFAARKNVLEYDDVMNLQRKAIYDERNAILDGKDMDARIPEIIADAVAEVVSDNVPDRSVSDDWDFHAIDLWVTAMTGTETFHAEEVDHDDDPNKLEDAVCAYLQECYDAKRNTLGEKVMNSLESQVMLRIIDTRWMAHLADMDYLKSGIYLRAYGQRDPLVEYKNEAYEAFKAMTSGMYTDFLKTMLRLQIATGEEQLKPASNPLAGRLSYSSPQATLDNGNSVINRGGRGVAPTQADVEAQARAAAAGQPLPKSAVAKAQTVRKDDADPFANVGRNDPCPCGSGLKYKKCHGANQ